MQFFTFRITSHDIKTTRSYWKKTKAQFEFQLQKGNTHAGLKRGVLEHAEI